MEQNPYASPQQPVSSVPTKRERPVASWWWFAAGMTVACSVAVGVMFAMTWVTVYREGWFSEDIYAYGGGALTGNVFLIACGLAASGVWRGFRYAYWKKHQPGRIARIAGGISFLPAFILLTSFVAAIQTVGVFTVLALIAVYFLAGIIAVEVEVRAARWFTL